MALLLILFIATDASMGFCPFEAGSFVTYYFIIVGLNYSNNRLSYSTIFVGSSNVLRLPGSRHFSC